jgi:class 3 adenylate cyclase/tetratricopeptide (TPR) repeat protein
MITTRSAARLGEHGVQCQQCGQRNPDGAQFCNACGQRLAPVAAPAKPPSTPLPDHLAEKARHGGAALAGERKRVTVLFADVQGSMDLSGALDPEDWRGIMERFIHILCDGVHRFEGTVDKFTGDGIMALFGAPIAHEDHAARACYAALHLRDELAEYATELRRDRGLSFSVRIGMNSGEVVVGVIGDDLGLEYTAIGHTVGLAQRMEALAEPGKAYLTEHTARLVEGFFELADLGEFAVRGAGELLHVHELRGVGKLRTRLEVSAARGLSRFVGRGEEIELLEQAWQRAAAGDAELITIEADAGTGKSRLAYEFMQSLRARNVEVYEAHGLAHTQAVPFLPVLEILRDYFGVAVVDDDRSARDKVAGRLLLLDEGFRDDLPLVFDFLGITDTERPLPPMDPEARQRRLFAMLERLLIVRSAQAPAAILVEDLHWIDPGSEAFLANLVESMPGTRTFVVATLRPGYSATWRTRSRHEHIELRPLGREAVDELLAGILGTDPSLDGLSDVIRERTGGNPFFVEEVVRSLTEGGTLEGAQGAYRLAKEVGEVAIPPSVESVLAARIDSLAERDKAVLETAAVIGREFSAPVLSRVTPIEGRDLEAALRALVDGGFVYEEALYPHARYTFVHALTEEVAYRSQLGERRARTHAAVAAAIEELEADRLDERAALLAHHWMSARDSLQAARWHARAAAWAGFTDALEAVRHWRRVRDLTREGEGEAAMLGLTARVMLLNFAWRLGREAGLRGEVDALFAEGEELAERTGAQALHAILIAAYGGAVGVAGRMDQTVALGERALRLAEEIGDRGLQIAIGPFVTYPMYTLGRIREALELTDDLLSRAGGDRSLGAGIGMASPHLWCEWWHWSLAGWLGEFEQTRIGLERCLRVARETGDFENQIWIHMNIAMHGTHGVVDPDSALAHARAAVELAERYGGSFSRAWSTHWLGWVHALREEWAAGETALRAALEIARDGEVALEAESLMLTRLARVQLGRGDQKGARASAEEALGRSLAAGSTFQESQAHVELARALLATDGAAAEAEVRTHLDRALALTHELGTIAIEPAIRALRAQLARALGDEDEAERELALARERLVVMGAVGPAELLLAGASATHG